MHGCITTYDVVRSAVLGHAQSRVNVVLRTKSGRHQLLPETDDTARSAVLSHALKRACAYRRADENTTAQRLIMAPALQYTVTDLKTLRVRYTEPT